MSPISGYLWYDSSIYGIWVERNEKDTKYDDA